MRVRTIKLSLKRRKKMFVKSVIILIIFYIVYLFISQQVKIKMKKDELERINQQITTEKEKKDSILDANSKQQNEENAEKSNIRVFENVAQ